MLQENLNNFFMFVKKNKFLFLLFILSTSFFIFQHYKLLTWDFSAYVLNAKYLFYNGSYFELLRPPLVPVILGIFLFLGKISEYIFIVIVSTLFFYSSVYLSDVLFKNASVRKEVSRFFFYLFLLSVYVLSYGLKEGTELISLSFLMFFVAFVLRKKISGYLLGFGVLCRYNLIMFTPFLFFYKNYKKILINIGLFALVLFPWFLFNYLNYGNFMASIIDSITLNILNRGYLFEAFTFYPLLEIILWLLPLFLIGLVLGVISIVKRNKNKYQNIVFFLLLIFILYDFITNPQKKVRFLFNFVLPVAYFSSYSFLFFISKLKEKYNNIEFKLIILFFVIFAFTVLVLAFSIPRGNDVFYRASEDINKLGLEGCEILSPHWVPVAYYTQNVYPFYDLPIKEMVEENKTVLIFKNLGSIDFTNIDLTEHRELVFYENNDYVFFSRGSEVCSKKYVYDKSYVDYLFCPSIARRFADYGLEDSFKRICYLFNKN